MDVSIAEVNPPYYFSFSLLFKLELGLDYRLFLREVCKNQNTFILVDHA